MTLAQRTKDYQALTIINLPFLNGGAGKKILPGDPVPVSELIEAQQTDEDVAALVKNGALGEIGDDVHPDHQPVDPNVPSIQLMIEQAKITVDDMRAKNQNVPQELLDLASMDHNHVVALEEGASNDSTSSS